jgi:hypothetical protein
VNYTFAFQYVAIIIFRFKELESSNYNCGGVQVENTTKHGSLLGFDAMWVCRWVWRNILPPFLGLNNTQVTTMDIFRYN